MRLDRFTAKAVPLLSLSFVQKYIRIKRVKVNGKGKTRDYRLCEGDTVQMYINDEYFLPPDAKPELNKSFYKTAKSDVDIIYEDENIIIVNKPVGLLCHSAKEFYQDTLITRIQAYLYKKGEWYPGSTAESAAGFVPALCNRIDRNTSGLVIAAKNAPALRIICDKLRSGEINKYYLVVVHGVPKGPNAVLEGYIFKDSVKNRVYMTEKNTPGAKYAIMEYEVIGNYSRTDMPAQAGDKYGILTVMRCHLITGRTHQIRVQLAGIGHPILGDGKYGRGDMDKPYGESKQALLSYKVVFNFKTDAGILSYLNNQTFELPEEDFIQRYVNKLCPSISL